MTGELVLSVCEKYKIIFQEIIDSPDFVSREMIGACNQCLFMIDKITEFVKADRVGKAFRWLGFIQGCMWSFGIRTIDDMKDDNRGYKLQQ